jgi:hypothetical protein
VDVAREIVPDLEAAPNAPQGIVRDASLVELRRDAAPGDFVLSRSNAPLVSLCMAFLGTDTGTAFAAYARTYSNRLTIDDIERGKFDKSKIDKISPNDKISLAGGILAKYFCNPLTQEVANNMCRFLVSLDLEIAYRALNGKTKEFPFKWNSVKDCGLSKEQQETQISNVVKTTQQSKWPISGIWAEGYKIEANAKAKK